MSFDVLIKTEAAAPSYNEHCAAREGGAVYVHEYYGKDSAFVVMHGFRDNLHIHDDLVPHLGAGGASPDLCANELPDLRRGGSKYQAFAKADGHRRSGSSHLG